MSQTLDTMSADLASAASHGGAGNLPIVAMVGGVEVAIGALLYKRGEITLDTGSQDQADRIVVVIS